MKSTLQALMLKVMLPRYSHWTLYCHGKYSGPEFGLMDELCCKAKVSHNIVRHIAVLFVSKEASAT